jgi:hypothetical protein
MANELNLGNKLIPGTPGAFTPKQVPATSFQRDNLTQALEERLNRDLLIAEERRQQRAQKIGVQPIEDKPKIGFTPTAVRQKGRVIAEKKMADIRSQLDVAAEDLTRSLAIQDQAARANKKIELIKRGGDLQFKVLQSALDLDRQITGAKLKQQERLALFKGLGGLAQTIGFAYATGRGGQPEFGGGGGQELPTRLGGTGPQNIQAPVESPFLLSSERGSPFIQEG